MSRRAVVSDEPFETHPSREAMEAIDYSGASYATLGPQCAKEAYVANSFGSDIIFETEDPQKAAAFYVAQLGFEVTDVKPNMISLHGNCINMFIERGPSLGPVFEVTVDSVEEAKVRLLKNGCTIVKDEPEFPRCYVKDPYGLIYNLTT
jgi:hypothetical protein